jgi:hypothetical protein
MPDLVNNVILHPNPSVDIAAIFFLPFANAVPQDMQPRFAALSEKFHLTPQEKTFTRTVEPILMIGYPNGLWDTANNRPIARRGVTASHPLDSWEGQRMFVIDAACYRGSSGSPVFLFEDGMFRNSRDGLSPGTRTKLIGVLFSGPTVNNEGRLEQRTIPTNISVVPVVEGMLNLGFVAHADTILDLKDLIKQRLDAE